MKSPLKLRVWISLGLLMVASITTSLSFNRESYFMLESDVLYLFSIGYTATILIQWARPTPSFLDDEAMRYIRFRKLVLFYAIVSSVLLASLITVSIPFHTLHSQLLSIMYLAPLVIMYGILYTIRRSPGLYLQLRLAAMLNDSSVDSDTIDHDLPEQIESLYAELLARQTALENSKSSILISHRHDTLELVK